MGKLALFDLKINLKLPMEKLDPSDSKIIPMTEKLAQLDLRTNPPLH